MSVLPSEFLKSSEDVHSVQTATSPTSPGDLRASLDDALAQLEVVRHQRTEVSAELYKCRCVIDELKEQKSQLQTEMMRRLTTHREDVERIQAMQKELDKLRGSYSSKESEIIELSTRIQDLMAKLQSTEQHRELKEENQLLWRKLDEMKRAAPVVPEAEDASLADRWRSRFNAIESALTEAYTARVPMSEEQNGEDDIVVMLERILSAEESLRKNLSLQISALRTELRQVKDELESAKGRLAQNEVAALKADLNNEHISKVEAERDQLEQQLEAVKLDLLKSQTDLKRLQKQNSDLAMQNRALKTDHILNEGFSTEIDQLKSDNAELKSDNAELKSDNAELKSDNAELRSTNEQLKSNNAELKSDNVELKSKIIDLRSEVASLKVRIKNVKMVSSEAESEESAHKRLRTENEKLQATVEELTQTLESEREDFKDGQAEWWRIEKELKAKLERLEKKSNDKHLRQEFQRQLEKVQSELEQVTEEKERLEKMALDQGDQEDLRAKLRAVESELASTETAMQEQRDSMEEMQTKLSSLETEKEELESKLAETETRLSELESEKADVDAKLAELESEKAELEGQKAELEKERGELESELVHTKEELETKVSELSTKVAELSEELEEALNGPSVASLVADFSQENLSPQQQVTRLKMALNRAHDARREAEGLAEVHKMRLEDSLKENATMKAQMDKVEEGWKMEYDVYVNNLSRITAALDKANAEKKILEDELNTLKTKIPKPNPPPKKQVVVDQSPTPQRVKPAKQADMGARASKVEAAATRKVNVPSAVDVPVSKEVVSQPRSVEYVYMIGVMILCGCVCYWCGQTTH